MSNTLNLTDSEVKTLYDILVQTDKTTTEGEYADDVNSMREKVRTQL